jgi:hypothetical protein
VASRGGYAASMADNPWTVQIGVVDDPGNSGVPPVPDTVYEGDEEGARAAFGEFSAKAAERDYRYVMLRHVGDVVDLWGTPPAVG